MVSTSVCGTESSGSTPDRDLLFGVDHSPLSERLFYFFFFLSFGTRQHKVLTLVRAPLFSLTSQGCKFESIFYLLTRFFFQFLTARAFCFAPAHCAGDTHSVPHLCLDRTDCTYKFVSYYSIITSKG